MILYVVHGNTYFDSYGYEEHIFGVYTKKDTAETVRDLVVKEIYEEEFKLENVDDITEVEGVIDILEIESDATVNIELGGYRE